MGADLKGGAKVAGHLIWHGGNLKKSEFAPAVHTHAIADITNLSTTLAGKSDTGHNHDTVYYTKTNMQTSGQASVHWGNVTNVTAATTSAAGIVQLNSATNSTSATQAATPAAVKAAYDLAASKANASHTHAIADLTDFSITNITSGQFLRYDGTKWVNATIAATDLPNAALNAKGVVQLSSSVASTSETEAATPKAVKDAYDLAASKSDSAHLHDDRYYTETEIDTKLQQINDYRQAQFTVTGGGTVTWDGTNLKWTARFIAIPLDKPAGSAGFIDIIMPAVSTVIDNVGSATDTTVVAAGIPLNQWHALYAVHTIGGTNSAVTYKIVDFASAPANSIDVNWVLVAVRGENNQIRLGSGVTIAQNDSVTNSRPSISSIDSLVTTLAGKAASSHTHGVGDLTDFAIATPASAQFLRYNGTKWANAAIVAADLPDASITAEGIVQLNDNTNSTSTTQAATANAVKKAYDLAATKANSSDVYTKTNLQTTGQASVHWGNLTNVPATFAPSAHNHNDVYYTKTEADDRYIEKAGDNMEGGLSFGGRFKLQFNANSDSLQFVVI